APVEEIDNMKRWLLKQKQTQLWESTHATADAVFALLSTGSDWFSSEGETEIKLGDTVVDADSKELGTGYIKESWSRKEITPDMGNVSVAHRGNSPAWGALYLQFFEDIDKVEKIDGSLDIEKLMFIEETTSEGVRLKEISDDNQINVGDKVVVRLTVRVDRDMEFVHIKDMRASAFEPINQLSRIGRQNGVVYYETSLDASTNFFFDNLPKGTYLFEYSVYASREGSYSSGMATIESMYATEFKSHTAGERIVIKD
ncbi:MAG TPA: hypothetical protein VKX35_07850, partial [Fermentimonas sp.]|nr:hypothetical protein [Fermentimonas sp.]